MKAILNFIDVWGNRIMFFLIIIVFFKTCTTNGRVDKVTKKVDTLEVNSAKLPTDGWTPYPVTTRWFPDAFIGTMGSLLGAIAGKDALRSSVEENLGTLKLVAALYESIATNRVIKL